MLSANNGVGPQGFDSGVLPQGLDGGVVAPRPGFGLEAIFGGKFKFTFLRLEFNHHKFISKF